MPLEPQAKPLDKVCQTPTRRSGGARWARPFSALEVRCNCLPYSTNRRWDRRNVSLPATPLSPSSRAHSLPLQWAQLRKSMETSGPFIEIRGNICKTHGNLWRYRGKCMEIDSVEAAPAVQLALRASRAGRGGRSRSPGLDRTMEFLEKNPCGAPAPALCSTKTILSNGR